MNQKEERAYLEGKRAAWLRMLQEVLTGLGHDSKESSETSWLLERQEAIAALRRVCGKHGDNDWPDDLSLADVIDKHLGQHLDK
jgi:post-segregation antitoxin (ccd killing protein)